jgi:hypothetical protein
VPCYLGHDSRTFWAVSDLCQTIVVGLVSAVYASSQTCNARESGATELPALVGRSRRDGTGRALAHAMRPHARAKKRPRPERQVPGVDASGNSRVKQSPWKIANAGEEPPEAGPCRRSTSEVSLATASRSRCRRTGFVAGVSRSPPGGATLHRPVRQLG